MALNGQRRSLPCLELIRGIVVLLCCKGPCPPGQSGPDDRSAFTESTTWTLASEAEVAQTMGGQISPDIINLSPLTSLAPPSAIIAITHPPCHSPLSYHSQSLFLPFLLLAIVSGAVPVAVTSLCWWEHPSWLAVTVWCLGTLTSLPGSSSPSGLWGERPGCEPSTPTSVFPSAVDTEDTDVNTHQYTTKLFISGLQVVVSYNDV